MRNIFAAGAALIAICMASSAQARILGVNVDKDHLQQQGRLLYVVTAEVCSNSFPSVIPTASKISDNVAQLDLEVVPGLCEAPDVEARFLISVDHQLEMLNMDPATTKILVQMQ